MFSWIHMSDLHFNFNKEPADMAFMRKSMLQYIDNNIKCNYLFVTGDISDKNCYDGCENYIKKIIKAAGINKDNVLISIGNHDVNRKNDKRNTRIKEILIEGAGKFQSTKFKSYMEDPEKKDTLYLTGHKEYLDFHRKVLRRFEDCNPHQIYYLKDVTVAVLNTCLTSSNGDEGNLFILSSDFEKTMDKIRNSENPVIVMGHHGTSFFQKAENNDESKGQSELFEHSLDDAGADLYLCGHSHRLGAKSLYKCSRQIYQITTGAIKRAEGGYLTSFIYGKCDLDKSIIELTAYCYNSGSHLWEANNTISRSLELVNPIQIKPRTKNGRNYSLIKHIMFKLGFDSENNSNIYQIDKAELDEDFYKKLAIEILNKLSELYNSNNIINESQKKMLWKVLDERSYESFISARFEFNKYLKMILTLRGANQSNSVIEGQYDEFPLFKVMYIALKRHTGSSFSLSEYGKFIKSIDNKNYKLNGFYSMYAGFIGIIGNESRIDDLLINDKAFKDGTFNYKDFSSLLKNQPKEKQDLIYNSLCENIFSLITKIASIQNFRYLFEQFPYRFSKIFVDRIINDDIHRRSIVNEMKNQFLCDDDEINDLLAIINTKALEPFVINDPDKSFEVTKFEIKKRQFVKGVKDLVLYFVAIVQNGLEDSKIRNEYTNFTRGGMEKYFLFEKNSSLTCKEIRYPFKQLKYLPVEYNKMISEIFANDAIFDLILAKKGNMSDLFKLCYHLNYESAVKMLGSVLQRERIDDINKVLIDLCRNSKDTFGLINLVKMAEKEMKALFIKILLSANLKTCIESFVSPIEFVNFITIVKYLSETTRMENIENIISRYLSIIAEKLIIDMESGLLKEKEVYSAFFTLLNQCNLQDKQVLPQKAYKLINNYFLTYLQSNYSTLSLYETVKILLNISNKTADRAISMLKQNRFIVDNIMLNEAKKTDSLRKLFIDVSYNKRTKKQRQRVKDILSFVSLPLLKDILYIRGTLHSLIYVINDLPPKISFELLELFTDEEMKIKYNECTEKRYLFVVILKILNNKSKEYSPCICLLMNKLNLEVFINDAFYHCNINIINKLWIRACFGRKITFNGNSTNWNSHAHEKNRVQQNSCSSWPYLSNKISNIFYSIDDELMNQIITRQDKNNQGGQISIYTLCTAINSGFFNNHSEFLNSRISQFKEIIQNPYYYNENSWRSGEGLYSILHRSLDMVMNSKRTDNDIKIIIINIAKESIKESGIPDEIETQNLSLQEKIAFISLYNKMGIKFEGILSQFSLLLNGIELKALLENLPKKARRKYLPGHYIRTIQILLNNINNEQKEKYAKTIIASMSNDEILKGLKGIKSEYLCRLLIQLSKACFFINKDYVDFFHNTFKKSLYPVIANALKNDIESENKDKLHQTAKGHLRFFGTLRILGLIGMQDNILTEDYKKFLKIYSPSKDHKRENSDPFLDISLIAGVSTIFRYQSQKILNQDSYQRYCKRLDNLYYHDKWATSMFRMWLGLYKNNIM